MTIETVTQALAREFGATTPFSVFTEGNVLVLRVNGVSAQIHNWQLVSINEIVRTAKGVTLKESAGGRTLING